MTDDRFFERLREHAAQLRYAPQDEIVWTRLAARIRDRVSGETTVAQTLAHWLRPVTASFLALALISALSVTWIERRDTPRTDALTSSSTVEIALDGDTYTLAE